MYPKEFFLDQFSEVDTEQLLLKLSGDLSDNARDAIVEVMSSRGVPIGQLDVLTKTIQKAAIRSSKGTTECDYCGNSARKKFVLDEGQRFCTSDCLHAARISEAAVDLTADKIRERAQAIRTGRCPECKIHGDVVEVRYYHRVASFIYFTRYERKSRVCCRSCGRAANMEAFWFTLFAGWWGVPFGIFMTPTYLVANLWELREHRFVGEPSDDLVRLAKLQLAEKSYLLARH